MGDVPEELTICGSEEQLEGCCGKIVICERNPRNKKSGVLYLLPRNLYVGMGCKKGTKKEILEAELLKTLEKHGFFTGADPCTWKHRSEKGGGRVAGAGRVLLEWSF